MRLKNSKQIAIGNSNNITHYFFKFTSAGSIKLKTQYLRRMYDEHLDPRLYK